MKNKNLKKGIEDAKEGRVTILKDYTTPSDKTIEELFKKDEREKYLYYRIYLYFYGLFWQLVRLPGDIRRNIRDFFQRGRRGWANSDTWEFSHYLSKVILGGVEHLEKIQHGMPTWKPGKTDLECANEWDCILNAIINTFRLAKEISDGKVCYLPLKDFTEKEYRRLAKALENSKHRMKVLNRKEVFEYEEGFRLFAEYFFSLWD